MKQDEIENKLISSIKTILQKNFDLTKKYLNRDDLQDQNNEVIRIGEIRS